MIIPLDAQQELQVQAGDQVWVEKSGGDKQDDLERQVAVARLVMERRRWALAELAK